MTGAADDRTFVIDATPATEPTQPNHVPQPAHTWYLLRIAPGTQHPAELTKLPIALPANSAGVVGLALSPDAGTLAVLSQPGQGGPAGDSAQGAGGPFTLRTFSLATGKPLRTWTAPEGKISTTVPGGSDNEAGLTWTADGQTLAFMFPPAAWPDYERTLNVTGKGTSLLTDSRPVLAIPNPGKQDNCLSLLLASDGRTMVCGIRDHRQPRVPARAPVQPVLGRYREADSRPLPLSGHLFQRRGGRGVGRGRRYRDRGDSRRAHCR